MKKKEGKKEKKNRLQAFSGYLHKNILHIHMYIFFLPTAGLGGGNGNVAKDGVGETQKRPSLVQKAKVSKEKKSLSKDVYVV